MPKFRYRMQNVLDVKLNLETQEKAAFGAANARLYEEQEKLQKLMVRRAGYERQMRELTTGTLNLQEINVCRNAIQSIKYMIRDQMLEVRKAQREVEIARMRLDTATKERKIQEKLKEKAFEAFKMELNAEEMKQIDQLVSYTYGAKQAEEKE